MTSQPVLEVENLAIDYKIGTDWKTAVRDINFTIERGQTFGLVGESGCGKSTVAMAIMHYLPRNGRIGKGSIRLAGQGSHPHGRQGTPPGSGQSDLDGLSGSFLGPQPIAARSASRSPTSST